MTAMISSIREIFCNRYLTKKQAERIAKQNERIEELEAALVSANRYILHMCDVDRELRLELEKMKQNDISKM